MFSFKWLSKFSDFLAALPNFSSENGGHEGKLKQVFVGYYSLEEFVQSQKNKNTNKTQRDVTLLKKFFVSRNEPRELENIDARDLIVLIANFLLQL